MKDVGAARILVVEQDPDLIGLISALLKDAGFTVMEANDPAGAMSQLASHPNAVVVDATLGQWSGLDLIKDIRRRSDVPIVVLGDGQGPQAQAATRVLGADAYVSKPISRRELVDAISQQLARPSAKL